MTILYVIKYSELLGMTFYGVYGPKELPFELRTYIARRGLEYHDKGKLTNGPDVLDFYKEVLMQYEGPL